MRKEMLSFQEPGCSQAAGPTPHSLCSGLHMAEHSNNSPPQAGTSQEGTWFHEAGLGTPIPPNAGSLVDEQFIP